MKKTVYMLMMILCIILSPLAVSAGTYTLAGTDMTVSFDESMWYVFTRDNLVGNPELDELGFTYDEFYANMVEQNMVVDACLFYDDGDYIEVLIMTEKEDGYVNLSNYSDSEVLELGKRTFEDFEESDNIEVYENQYKYMVIDYYDDQLYLHQYVTVINGYSYSIQFQSPYEFTEDKLETADLIVEAIRFDVDPSLKEPNLFLDTLLPAIFRNVAVRVISAVIVGGIAVVVIAVVVSNKKRS